MNRKIIKLIFIFFISSVLFGISDKDTISNSPFDQSSDKRFVTADFDNDGDIDIFVIYQDKEDTLWLNEGNFNFRKSSFQFDNIKSNSVATGDINGDGTPDLYIAGLEKNLIWLNDGSGKFSLAEHHTGDRISTGILLSDLDNNGTLDAVLSFNNRTIKTFYNNGSGEFFEGEFQFETNYIKDLTIHDFNRDGYKDLMVAAYNHPQTILINDRAGNLIPSDTAITLNISKRFSEIDINGDNLKDILVVNEKEDPEIWMNSGDGNFIKKYLGMNKKIIDTKKTDIKGMFYVPIVNNGFETGDFSGWIARDMAVPFCNLRIVQAGSPDCWGFFSYSPTEGNFALANGFDGCGPDYISIEQEVKLPPGQNILKFDYRLGYNWGWIGTATQNRIFKVIILKPKKHVTMKHEVAFRIDKNVSYNLDTGNLTGDLELTEFSGQTIIVKFEWFIPECYTGPSQFQLDNIRILNSSGPLSIEITEPDDGAVVSGRGSAVNVNTNSPGITKLEYYLNDILLHSSNNPGNTLYWNTTLYPNGDYTLKVIAFNNLGQTGMDSVNIRIENIALDLNAVRKSENSWLIKKDFAELSFSVVSGDSNNISKYALYRKEGNGEYSLLSEISAGNSSYSDSTINEGVSYTYQVKALDGDGNVIGTSNEVSI